MKLVQLKAKLMIMFLPKWYINYRTNKFMKSLIKDVRIITAEEFMKEEEQFFKKLGQ